MVELWETILDQKGHVSAAKNLFNVTLSCTIYCPIPWGDTEGSHIISSHLIHSAGEIRNSLTIL